MDRRSEDPPRGPVTTSPVPLATRVDQGHDEHGKGWVCLQIASPVGTFAFYFEPTPAADLGAQLQGASVALQKGFVPQRHRLAVPGRET